MKSKVFSGLLFIIIPGIIIGQNLLKGEIHVSDSLYVEELVEIYEKDLGFIVSSTLGGTFEIMLDKEIVNLILLPIATLSLKKELISLKNLL